MIKIADEKLMLQYANDDVEAFTTLYRRHKDSLYRYFLRQVSTRELAEELFQEVWNKLIKARSSYQITSKFTTWLYRIAHNELVDFYRRNASENKVIAFRVEDGNENYETNNHKINEHSEVNEYSATEHVSAFDEHYLKQQVKQLKLCLTLLPRGQKEAFLLKHEAGFTLKEIAELVGESSEGIKSRLRYGLSKLKHCVMQKMRGADEG